MKTFVCKELVFVCVLILSVLWKTGFWKRGERQPGSRETGRPAADGTWRQAAQWPVLELQHHGRPDVQFVPLGRALLPQLCQMARTFM